MFRGLPPGRDCPEVLVAEHTLVRARHAGEFPGGLGDVGEELWHALASAAGPVTVVELALRLALPAGVVKVLVSHLVDARLVEVSAVRPGRAVLEAALGERDGGVGLAAVKIVVVGGPSSGTTTLLGAASTVPPVAVGERLPAPGGRVTTTVREWGRFPLDGGVEGVLAAAHVSADARPAWWDDLGLWRGASGAVVMVHPARWEESCPAVDWLEERGLPYAVGVDALPGTVLPDAGRVREMLRTDGDTPVVLTDVRSPESARFLLRDALRHAARAAAGGAW
ncbi:DUF742 domain-containing protein [Thermobifida halotolerans]|uniref:DUF742 domain-containing protein n=1 Tax=Thermobifida halotolerans TaxID=483545 RepID=UPI000A77FE2B|nr:DUF742 domain-containing protein [Thermobifida halotolerans]